MTKSITMPMVALVATLAAPPPLAAAPTVYVPLGSANEVVAVDAATHRVTKRFSGVENPHGLVATPDGEYLVAGSLNETPVPAGAPHDTPNSKLYLIHPEHGHVTLVVPVAGWTHHQAITPDGRYVLSTHPTRGYVSVLDLESNTIARTVPTGPAPNYTLVSRDGKRAYVSNSGNGTVSEIDLSTWKVTRTLAAGPGPEHLVFSGDERTIYVTNPKAGSVSAVSLASGKVERSYKIADKVHGLDIGNDGKTLFVSSQKGDVLVAIDTSNGAERRLTLAPAPYHLNTIRATGEVYVSSRSAPKIWIVDQKTLKLIGEIALPGGEGHQMAVVR
ncbi:MAG TPA: YncE family protein [Acidiferrobacterales bacterium]